MAAAKKGVIGLVKQVHLKRLMDGRFRNQRFRRKPMDWQPPDRELIKYIVNLDLFEHIYIEPFLLPRDPCYDDMLSKTTCYVLPCQGDNIYHNYDVYVPQPGYVQPFWKPKLPHPYYSSWFNPSDLPSLLAPPRIIFNFDDDYHIDIFEGVGKIHKRSPYEECCLSLHEGSYEAIQEYNSNKTQHEHLYLDHVLRGSFQSVAGYNFFHLVFKASEGLLDESETYEAIVFGLEMRWPSRKLVLFRKYDGSKNLPTPMKSVVGEICECALPSADPMITYAGCFAVAEYNKKYKMLRFKRVVRATTQVISATSAVTRVYKIVRLEFEAVPLKSGKRKSYEAILLVHEHDNSEKMELVIMSHASQI